MTNLLEQAWIPVRLSNQLSQISLETLLTSDSKYHLALPRDDMESAALQLLISLVQRIETPKDWSELRNRADAPINSELYREWVTPHIEAFDLAHTSHPFMQATDSKAKEPTPIQKLFVGLPEGNNHAFFNDPGEVTQTCGGCAAIALFNLASNAPGFSGKHKAGLRGGGKINTFALGRDLRETIWLNVLTQSSVDELLPDANNDEFCWQNPIVAKSKIQALQIGLNRGLFWQPLRLKLNSRNVTAECDHCGQPTTKVFTSFLCEADFKFEVVGQWPHPHSPRQWDINKGNREKERYLSFRQMVPAWTQLNHFVVNCETDKSASVRAPIIRQFEQVFQDRKGRKLNLLIAAYTNKQAAILERRHESYSLPADLQSTRKILQSSIDAALKVRDVLRGQLYYFGKETGASVHVAAEKQFYQQTESLLHTLLREFSFKDGKVARKGFIKSAKASARCIFAESTLAYRYQPAGLAQYAKSKRSFDRGLNAIEG